VLVMTLAVTITLSHEERLMLERRAAKLTLPYRDVQRAKVILYAAEGLSNVEIAGRLEMCSKVVGQWRRRFCAHRLDGLHGRVARGVFPPHEVAQVKAIACELPRTHGLPLSRFSRSELHRFVVEQAISDASASTIGRWLTQDAIKPWQTRSWIFPRDPKFLQRGWPDLGSLRGPVGREAA
jgi:hypothetical protein